MCIGLIIRPATASDAEAIFGFVAALIEDHLPGQQPWTSVDQLRADGFGDDPMY